MEQHVGEQLLEGVARISWSVLHIRPHRLVQLHQELLRRRPQLLNHLVPLVDILWFIVRKSTRLGLCEVFHACSASVLETFAARGRVRLFSYNGKRV